MGKLICSVFVALTTSSVAAVQVTSLESANPAPNARKWNPNKFVCEHYETTGIRSPSSSPLTALECRRPDRRASRVLELQILRTLSLPGRPGLRADGAVAAHRKASG